jgi:methionine synthase II (cobalamin-independent)
MQTRFHAGCLPALIGSLPLTDHRKAADWVWAHTPDIPVWIQLPAHPKESMLLQFAAGMPGLVLSDDSCFIDTTAADFDDALVRFYETFMAVGDHSQPLDETCFALDRTSAEGFFVLLASLGQRHPAPTAVKGQITGPITFTTGVADQNKTAIFHDDRLRDAAVKLLAMKARWQVEQLAVFQRPVILFLDEPALAGYGSSEFTSISKEAVLAALGEVIDAVHDAGGLAGIHVCANTDWQLVLETPVDIVNFDAYSFFDRFVLYGGGVREFLNQGRIIAWGIVPTSKPEDIDRETATALRKRWESQIRQIASLGLDPAQIKNQSLITPSCGTGSLSRHHAKRVLELTRDLSLQLRTSTDAL